MLITHKVNQNTLFFLSYFKVIFFVEFISIWLNLKIFFELEAHNALITNFFNDSFDMTLTEYHLLVYNLDPMYFESKLINDKLAVATLGRGATPKKLSCSTSCHSLFW